MYGEVQKLKLVRLFTYDLYTEYRVLVHSVYSRVPFLRPFILSLFFVSLSICPFCSFWAPLFFFSATY